MVNISKFYLLDATSPNTGTMPSNTPATLPGGKVGAGTEATGATTARDATDVIGTANPDTESSVTAAATSGALQRLGHRRFVSRPLAAQTFAAADGNWTFSCARSQSNTNHVGTSGFPTQVWIYLWRPSTGLQVGTAHVQIATSILAATAETASSTTSIFSGTQAILSGDILVFDVYSEFNQSMATAYTDQFAYNGTVEASTTTCASFISPPSPITLFTPSLMIPSKNIRNTLLRR
jgi:hypothetical protein